MFNLARSKEILGKVDSEIDTLVNLRKDTDKKLRTLRATAKKLRSDIAQVEGLSDSTEEAAKLLGLSEPDVSAPSVETEEEKPEVPTGETKPKPSRVKKVKRYGVLPVAAKILRIAFAADNVPSTLLEALQGAFGEDLLTQKISAVKGKGETLQRFLTEDTDDPDSILKMRLASAYRSLLLYEQESDKESTLAHPKLVELYQTITKRYSLNTVELTLQDWDVLPKSEKS